MYGKWPISGLKVLFLTMKWQEGYIDVYEWQAREIQKAIHYADSPHAEFITHEEIRKEFGNTVA